MLDTKSETQHQDTIFVAFWNGKQEVFTIQNAAAQPLQSSVGGRFHLKSTIPGRGLHVEGDIGTSLGVEANQLLAWACLDKVEAHHRQMCSPLQYSGEQMGFPKRLLREKGAPFLIILSPKMEFGWHFKKLAQNSTSRSPYSSSNSVAISFSPRGVARVRIMMPSIKVQEGTFSPPYSREKKGLQKINLSK